MLLITVIEQRVQIGHAFDHDIATLAAVAAVGATELNEFLPPERDTAIAAVARAHINLGLVEKLHGERLSTGAFNITLRSGRLSAPAGR